MHKLITRAMHKFLIQKIYFRIYFNFTRTFLAQVKIQHLHIPFLIFAYLNL